MMTRHILNWTKKEYEKVLESDECGVKEFAKAAGIGAIEGAIDGAVIVGLTAFVLGVVDIVKNATTKK